MNEEKIYNELKQLNISQVRGEERLKSIDEQFKTLNGSVKRHTKKIWWIEKVLWTSLGAFGAIQFYLSYFN